MNDGVVSWHYPDHPSRWVVAIFALGSAAAATGPAIRKTGLAENSISADRPEFLVAWVAVAFCLAVAIVSARPRIDGYFSSRAGTFELDTGRRAPDFLSALSFVFEMFQPRIWLKSDLVSVGREYSRRLFPSRDALRGKIQDIDSVTMEPGRFGPSAVITVSKKACVIAEDLPPQEIERVRHNIQQLINA